MQEILTAPRSSSAPKEDWFAKIPLWVLRRRRELKLGLTELCVYASLKCAADIFGNPVTRAMQTISDDVILRRGDVPRAERRLEDAALIECINRGGGRRSSTYRVTMTEAEQRVLSARMRTKPDVSMLAYSASASTRTQRQQVRPRSVRKDADHIEETPPESEERGASRDGAALPLDSFDLSDEWKNQAAAERRKFDLRPVNLDIEWRQLQRHDKRLYTFDQARDRWLIWVLRPAATSTPSAVAPAEPLDGTRASPSSSATPKKIEHRLGPAGDRLRAELGDHAFRAWCTELASEIAGDTLNLFAPTPMTQGWLCRHDSEIRRAWCPEGVTRVEIRVRAMAQAEAPARSKHGAA